MVDLRSDTVTKPSPDMRRAMAEAEVGDDIFGEDPTVNRLQQKAASLLGKEAALFVPSGSMANQAVIYAQTRPGDEIICHEQSHIYLYEGGAPAALAGCSLKLLAGERGQFTPEAARAAIRPADSHNPHTSLIAVENTHNRGGGSVWPIEPIAALRDIADECQLTMHLDGARLLNACAAKGCAPTEYTQYFDTVSTCFSKGLGAPVGSVVAGSAETIQRVHRVRKLFGGAMRQAGIIAAGALFALENNIDRLVDDHVRAKRLANALAELPGITISPDQVETNILYFDMGGCGPSAVSFCDAMKQLGVLLQPVGATRIRAVTHLDISDGDIEKAIDALNQVLATLPAV